MSEFFTEKQKEFIRDLKYNNLKRINILDGSVRSGKTWITLIGWALWIAQMPTDKKYLMVGKTLTTLKRNCLEPLIQLVGAENFKFSVSSKKAVLFGRNIDLEGANDAQSENKIRGLTLQGAYADEITLFPEDFFTMLLSRLSEKGAKFFGSTNPDSPSHWLKVKYLDREHELSLYRNSFVIDDNTFLDPEYVENIKSEYTGVFYERFILGHWVIAEGLIYSMFEAGRHVVPAEQVQDLMLNTCYVSCDYGTLNATVFLLWRKLSDGRWYIEKEYYYSGRKETRNKTDAEYADELEKFIEGIELSSMIVDPSAASFIAELKKRNIRVLKAKNDVIDGIRYTSTLLNQDRVIISPSCKETISEFGLYRWDETKVEDAVIKDNDHCMDAMRYFCYTVLDKRKVGTRKITI